LIFWESLRSGNFSIVFRVYFGISSASGGVWEECGGTVDDVDDVDGFGLPPLVPRPFLSSGIPYRLPLTKVFTFRLIFRLFSIVNPENNRKIFIYWKV